VATDTRLWLVSMVRTLRAVLQELIAAAVQRAEAEADVLMPGYTHLQPAMTVRWSHWLLSHAAAWQRDDMRLRDLQPRVATLPLGSGASTPPPGGVKRDLAGSRTTVRALRAPTGASISSGLPVGWSPNSE
jgi:argininosuccinate lyase